jgi:hexosaminidase
MRQLEQNQSSDSWGLWPQPRTISPIGGTLNWPDRPTVRLRGLPPALPPMIVQQLKALNLTVVMGNGVSATVEVAIEPGLPHAEEYRLTVGAKSVVILAADWHGVGYALDTLRQIIVQFGKAVPQAEINDWPELKRRGFYLDVSRGKVPTVEKLEMIIQLLARLRYNEFQIYIENIFEFPGHDFYADTTPLTAAEVRHLDRVCQGCGIDFVPSLTSLGHFDKILRHPRYRHLAEIEPAEILAQGIKPWCDDPWTLCISDPAAAELISDLYDAFLPHFSSSSFNICCDESWDLALGRSRDYARQMGGVGEVYVRWINQCAAIAARHGKSIALWGDIILNHPEKISALPRDATLLEWGYESDHPFDAHGREFAQSDRPWYVCPGTSSWQSFGGRLDTALANIRNAVTAGRRHSARGMLLTDWGDYGHQQCFVVSLVPLIAGAAIAWNLQTSDTEILNFSRSILGLHHAVDHIRLLGTLHGRIARQRPRNSSLEFRLFREPPADRTYLDMLNPDAAREVLVELDHALAKAQSGTTSIDRYLNDGLRISLEMSSIAIAHGLHRLGEAASCPTGSLPRRIDSLAEEYRIHWHRWNKPSRWVDIQQWFDKLSAQYR